MFLMLSFVIIIRKVLFLACMNSSTLRVAEIGFIVNRESDEKCCLQYPIFEKQFL